MVDVRRSLINIHWRCGRSNKAVRYGAGSNDCIGVRYQTKDRVGNRISSRCYGSALCLGEDVCAGRQALAVAQAFIAQEEVSLPLFDGPTEIDAELVALERCDWVR